jgi:uncharacterized damage-inducible protein DinB
MATTPVTQALIEELRAEADATRRILARVPADKLDWRPHPKSMSLGQLALHIARIPGDLSNLLATEGFDAANANFTPAEAATASEILTALEAALTRAEEFIAGLDEESLEKVWQFTNRGAPVFARARAKLVRSMIFNHWYHHRGQLSVYLRLLEVPVPVMYGRTADENPFA